MPSRRSSAPSSPGFVHRSAAFSSRRFLAAENWRRLAVAATSGSGAALDGASAVALRAPYAARQSGVAELGFDVANVRPDGKLVIGEAKSHDGNISNITAFGSTRIETLRRNLEELIKAVKSDPTLPHGLRNDILDQIDKRTFETELFLAPRGMVPSSRLDVFQDNQGRPLDRIIVLPEA